MNSCLVTGGAGYIGSHLTKKLCDLGHEVTIVDNLSTGKEKAIDNRATKSASWVKDLNYAEDNYINENIDTIYHLAASLEVGESVENPLKYYQNNVVELVNLLNWIRGPKWCGQKDRSKIKRLIFSSSCSVYGEYWYGCKLTELNKTNPISPYAKTKLMCDQILEDFSKVTDVKVISLRYFNVAGASLDGKLGNYNEKCESLIPKIIRLALKSQPIEIYGNDYRTEDGTCIRDYIHVEDIVNANIKCLGKFPDHIDSFNPHKNFKIYNIGSGKGFSVLEVVRELERVLNKNVEIIYKNRRSGDPEFAVADNTSFSNYFDWKPKYSNLRTMIETELNWIKKWNIV